MRSDTWNAATAVPITSPGVLGTGPDALSINVSLESGTSSELRIISQHLPLYQLPVTAMGNKLKKCHCC